MSALTKYLQWLERRTWTCKNVFLQSRQIPCVKGQEFVAAKHRSRTWNHCWLTGKVWKMFHYNSTLLRGILQSHSNNSSFLIILVLVKWVSVSCHDFLSTSVQRIRQLVVPELPSILPSRADFEFEFLEELFLSWLLLLVVELVLVEIQHIRDGRSPNPVVEH